MTYIEFTDYSLMIVYLAKQLGQNPLTCLQQPQQLDLNKLKVNSITDLDLLTISSDDLFGENSHTGWLVDILDSDLKDLDKLSVNENVYLFSSQIELKADDKKLLKKYNINYQELKKTDSAIVQEIAQEYCQQLGINSSEIKPLLSQAKSYQEILDNIDFVQLSDNSKNAVESLMKEEKLALFMRGFNVNNLPKDATTWAREVDENDLQLALSLIYSKLDKQNSKQLLQKLILTDQKIKTRSKIKPLTWFKLFLWQSANLDKN
jgi:hypothetical protein